MDVSYLHGIFDLIPSPLDSYRSEGNVEIHMWVLSVVQYPLTLPHKYNGRILG